jgi:hypothetical protein
MSKRKASSEVLPFKIQKKENSFVFLSEDTLRRNGSKTIKDLSDQICPKEESDPVILIDGIVAHRDRTVEYYSKLFPKKRWILYPRTMKESGLFQIFLRTTTGECITLNPESPSERMETLMRRIEQSQNVSVPNQRLVFAGKQLERHKKLKEYGIGKESTIHMVLRLRGGGSFADMSKAKFKKTKWSSNAPPWRKAEKGLCLEGPCRNDSCVAFGHDVIVNCGFGVTDVILDSFYCPLCRSRVKPTLPAFNNCSWRWYGTKSEEKNRSSISEWKIAHDRYEKVRKITGMANWDALMIETVEKVDSSERCVVCYDPVGEASLVDNAQASHSCGHSTHVGCSETCEKCPLCDLPFETLSVSMSVVGEKRAIEFPSSPDPRSKESWPFEINVTANAIPGGPPPDKVHLLLSEKSTLHDLMVRLMQRTGIPLKRQLLYSGKWFREEDFSADLTELGLKSGSTVSLVLRPEPKSSLL